MTNVVRVAGVEIGRGFTVIAGPCAVENEKQMLATAQAVQAAGASLLRGGAYKLRHSPYDFQGLGEPGLRLLRQAGQAVGLPVVSEITAAEQLPLFASTVDLLQIGARNMHNYELLKAVGRSGQPVLLKRGPAATVEEWLYAAEYIAETGNRQIILCERGIRTFEPQTRNTLDLSAVALAKRQADYPVLVDPSHAAGLAALVEPLSLAALAVGADGLMVEVHHEPEQALCDARQALRPADFHRLMAKLAVLEAALDV